MLEYIKELPQEEQEQIKDALQKLYRQTFILERKYDRKAGRMTANKEYYLCQKHMEFLTEYLAVAGIQLKENIELGTIYVQGEPLMGERFPRLATIYLLLLKLLYDEQMSVASNSVNICVTLGDLSARAGAFRLLKGLASYAEMKKALYLLKRYQLIEVPDSMEELNENTRIIIFPSINVVLMREDVEKLLASFTGEDYTLEPEAAEMVQEEPEQAEEGTEAEAFAKQQITEGEPDIDGEQ